MSASLEMYVNWIHVMFIRTQFTYKRMITNWNTKDIEKIKSACVIGGVYIIHTIILIANSTLIKLNQF